MHISPPNKKAVRQNVLVLLFSNNRFIAFYRA
jgi:hypothetical protein